ncbi:hypothetical protein [Halostella salina]|uniref:hypothetical protein n=1 Tax=Halostella salina TaxID=1547897 RepID=UPI001969D175|nr:hypothetical protein [Halostella salina]
MTRQSHRSRRTVLRTAAGAAVASVGGCLRPDDNGTTNGATDEDDAEGPFQRVAVEETMLVVELTTDATVDRINLIKPNGELFGQREVAAGVQQATFTIGTTYEPGEYRVLALRNGEQVGEMTVPIQPDVSIENVGIGRNQPEKMWDAPIDEIGEEAFVRVANQGTGPTALTKLLFIGDVPYPSGEEGTNYVNDEDISGIYDPASESEADTVVLLANSRVTIYSSRSPFAFVPGAGTSCTDEHQSGEFRLVLERAGDDQRISKSYNIQYTAAGETDSCDITIEGK